MLNYPYILGDKKYDKLKAEVIKSPKMMCFFLVNENVYEPIFASKKYLKFHKCETVQELTKKKILSSPTEFQQFYKKEALELLSSSITALFRNEPEGTDEPGNYIGILLSQDPNWYEFSLQAFSFRSHHYVLITINPLSEEPIDLIKLRKKVLKTVKKNKKLKQEIKQEEEEAKEFQHLRAKYQTLRKRSSEAKETSRMLKNEIRNINNQLDGTIEIKPVPFSTMIRTYKKKHRKLKFQLMQLKKKDVQESRQNEVRTLRTKIENGLSDKEDLQRSMERYLKREKDVKQLEKDKKYKYENIRAQFFAKDIEKIRKLQEEVDALSSEFNSMKMLGLTLRETIDSNNERADSRQVLDKIIRNLRVAKSRNTSLKNQINKYSKKFFMSKRMSGLPRESTSEMSETETSMSGLHPSLGIDFSRLYPYYKQRLTSRADINGLLFLYLYYDYVSDSIVGLSDELRTTFARWFLEPGSFFELEEIDQDVRADILKNPKLLTDLAREYKARLDAKVGDLGPTPRPPDTVKIGFRDDYSRSTTMNKVDQKEKSAWSGGVENPIEFSQYLVDEILSILSSEARFGQVTCSYIKGLLSYRKFVEDAGTLHMVNLDDLIPEKSPYTSRQLISFWINVHNAMMLQYMLEFDSAGQDYTNALKDFGMAKYDIGGKLFSILDISDTIVLQRRSDTKDLLDYRIDFGSDRDLQFTAYLALAKPIFETPFILPVHTAGDTKIEGDLRAMVKHMLERKITRNESDGKAVVILPSVFYWNSKFFQHSKSRILEYLSSFGKWDFDGKVVTKKKTVLKPKFYVMI